MLVAICYLLLFINIFLVILLSNHSIVCLLFYDRALLMSAQDVREPNVNIFYEFFSAEFVAME